MPESAKSKSIEELEGTVWEGPPPGTPPTFVRCYQIRRKPLSELRPADLYTVIGQDVGLDFVVPLALDALEIDPLLEAENYPGDLLASVLRVSAQYFQRWPETHSRVERLVEGLRAAMERLDYIDFDVSSEALEEAISRFRGAGKGSGSRR